MIVKGCACCLSTNSLRCRSRGSGNGNTSSHVGTVVTARPFLIAAARYAGSWQKSLLWSLVMFCLLLPFRYTDGTGAALTCVALDVLVTSPYVENVPGVYSRRGIEGN